MIQNYHNVTKTYRLLTKYRTIITEPINIDQLSKLNENIKTPLMSKESEHSKTQANKDMRFNRHIEGFYTNFLNQYVIFTLNQ